jgi:hypothetical protein
MKELLKKLNACESATEWAEGKSWEEVYNTCHRGDWLLWLFQRTNKDDLQLLTLAKGHCANTVRHLMTDERSIKAVDAAIAFGEGKITREELKIVADAAARAADAWAAVGAGSAWAAAGAGASWSTADAAAATAAARAAARAAVGAGAYHIAYEENQKITADICRKYLPIEIWNINL